MLLSQAVYLALFSINLGALIALILHLLGLRAQSDPFAVIGGGLMPPHMASEYLRLYTQMGNVLRLSTGVKHG